MEWYIKVLQHYFDFEGRARRKEFWMFVLVNLFVAIGVGIIGSMFGIEQTLSGLYSLAVFIPYLAVSVRRLHDTGRTGWWVLIYLIPLLGALVLLVFYVLDGEPGENEYGPDPKGPGA